MPEHRHFRGVFDEDLRPKVQESFMPCTMAEAIFFQTQKEVKALIRGDLPKGADFKTYEDPEQPGTIISIMCW